MWRSQWRCIRGNSCCPASTQAGGGGGEGRGATNPSATSGFWPASTRGRLAGWRRRLVTCSFRVSVSVLGESAVAAGPQPCDTVSPALWLALWLPDTPAPSSTFVQFSVFLCLLIVRPTPNRRVDKLRDRYLRDAALILLQL